MLVVIVPLVDGHELAGQAQTHPLLRQPR
jgi:hypothetical protein